MKKLLLTCATFGLLGSLAAQNWVPTTPQKRKVVLEEFTGVRCTFCPDGHKRAKALRDANPGNVFLINVHAGSFAAPGAGDLDLRTPEGTALDNAAGTLGYPNGSVNRNKNPWNSSRGAWASEANVILGENSPVNVYVKSTVDYMTRTLTTEVEVYYTSAGASTNRLTVALAQNEILGPQVGGTTYFPENFYNGQYIHNHAFRRMITSNGIDGETLDSTTAGAYIYRKFTTVLPDKIGTIDLDINQLEVVAFVTENGRNKILSGHGATVVNNDPNIVDLGVSDKTVIPNGICNNPITPKVEVTNNSSKTITSVKLKMEYDGQTYYKTYTGSLVAGAKTEVSFDPISTYGQFNIAATLDEVEGGAFSDSRKLNNQVSIKGMSFEKKAFTYLKADFEGSADKHTGFDLSENEKVEAYSPTNSSTVGFGSKGAIRCYLHSSWNIEGKPGHIILGEADFTGVTDPSLIYHYAYSDGGQGGTAPKIEVSVSEDCGGTWNIVETKTLDETGQPSDPRFLFAPTSSQYWPHKVDLSAKAANKTVLVRVSVIPGSSGNALYLDGLEIGSDNKLTHTVNTTEITNKVYPNPANDVLTISTQSEKATVNILNMEGKTVATQEVSQGTTEMNVSTLPKGIYMVQIKSSEKTEVVKVTII